MKNTVRFFFVVCLALSIFSVASATEPQKINVQGVDVTGAVDSIKKSVVTVQKPILMYHWFSAHPGSIWTQPLKTNDPIAVQYLMKASQTFLQEYGKDTGGNVYGRGLYLAVDPVVSQGFGGLNWVLIQMQLPVGFRAVDVKASVAFSPQEQAAFIQLGCGPVPHVSALFQPSSNTTAECRNAVAQILRDHVKIDGFFYSYGASGFQECKSAEFLLRNSALVVTSGSWIRPELIQVFNEKTPDAKEQRIRIQSLFYKSDHDDTLDGGTGTTLFYYGMKWVQTQFPGFNIFSSGTQCSGHICKSTAKICPTSGDMSQCKEVELPPVPPQEYPERISSQKVPLSILTLNRILWADLDGQPTDKNLSPWIQKNFLGCAKDQLKKAP